MRLKLTLAGLLVKLANHYTTQSTLQTSSHEPVQLFPEKVLNRRHLKDILQMMNMKMFFLSPLDATAECIPIKLKTKLRVLWESQIVLQKQDNLKKAFLHKIRYPTNINVLKFKKAQKELINTYQKEQLEYIQGQINKIRNSIKDKYQLVW